ncbi:MAG: hypothetical protein U9N82_08225 [Thermodesulfobacteriota bacterium]|nr:hypothetical protein [Thermodesulfobacteriota bacterium]
MKSTGFIEVDLFPADVNSLDHPYVIHFKELLEEIAEEHDSHLLHFDIDNGTVTFSFDSDELMADIIRILQDGKQSQP